MSATEHSATELEARIDAVESAYEFMLAYAAQGRESDRHTSEVRDFLGRMEAALDGLADLVSHCVQQHDAALSAPGADFFRALAQDATTSLALVRLLLSRRSISSQLIDNFNASIHVRALLTDLFIVDELLKDPPA